MKTSFALFTGNHFLRSHLRKAALLLAMAGAVAQTATAQSTWGGAGADQNWSTPLNWSAGGVPANNAVTFPNGAFPVTTNVQGAVNNIVQGNTQITSLIFNNVVPNFDTTLIPSGVTLTIGGGITVSGNLNITSAAITGGGTLLAGTNGTSTLAVESSGNGALMLDLSGLNTFVFNQGATSPGNFTIANTMSPPTSGTETLNLASASNNITAANMQLGNNNTRGTVTINLGNGTNILNADTFNIGVSKTSTTMQFTNNAGGGLKIANHTGTGRANINLSTQANSGSASATYVGLLSFNGGTVNILAGTLTMANRVARSGGGNVASLSFNNGTVDATTINMAINASGGGVSFATNSVGNSGILKIGTGGMSMINQGGTAGASFLFATNGGTIICSNNIYKSTANGVATIVLSSGSLSMASVAGTIGVSNNFPIDNFDVTNSTLNLPVTATAAVAVTSLNPDTVTTNIINISSMPSITSFPATFPVITYSAGTSGGNLATPGILPEIALGTLPNTIGTFSGYLSNDTSSATIWLVVTNGPLIGPALWGGQINNLWDSTTHNWTNGGLSVAFQNGDFATFDDTAHTTSVNITGTEKPASIEINNSTSNYTFTGVGKISGSVGLQKDGSGSLTLAETGGDDFSLGITNNAGTIILDNPGSAISGGLLIAGGATVQIGNNDTAGAIPSGALDNEGTLIFNRSDNLSVGNIPGGGALVKNGNGILTLTAANAYTGSTTINTNTLALTNSGAIANSSSVTVNSNATLDVSGVTTSATIQALNLSNATVTVKVGYLQTNFNVSSLTMTGTTNTINVRSLPPIAFYPATNVLLLSGSPISGYNFGLGSLPAGSAGTIALSGDGNSVLLILTSGPTNSRPSVTWSGVDALGGVNTNWSDAQNWTTPGVPASTEPVIFNDTATAGGTVFDVVGDGNGGVVNPGNIDNIVNTSLTNATLSYANSGTHNTQIAPGKTLTVNGNLTVSGSGGTATIFGTNAGMKVLNSGVIAVQNGGTAPTLDMSGLDTFTATVSQMGIGFNPANVGVNVKGTWYLARTNTITTGVGNFANNAALVVGGGTGATAGTGQLYLGQSNALYIDGIVLGMSTSTADLIEFNPMFTNAPPVAYIRGITGDSSRVTLWSLGDSSVNINNGVTGTGLLNDFSAGRLDALVNTLIVGQGSQGNTANANVRGIFNMGSGNLDVTTLNIGVGVNGKTGGMGIGVMNVSNGVVVANSLNLGIGTVATTSGTLNLTNATLVLSNGITVGTVAGAGTLSVISSTVKALNGTIGTPATPLTTLNLDGGILRINADAAAGAATIAAATVNAANTTTINLASVTNVTGTMQIPLLSYTTGTDPYPNLALGTVPGGYTVGNGGLLVDNAGNLSIDVILTASAGPTTNANILKATLSGTNLLVHGTNNNTPNTSFHYVVFSSTNVATPLSNWTPVVTNPFNPDGTFDYTNPIVPGTPRQFIDVEAVP